MVHGDTINVCKGSSIVYESTAQGSPLIDWRFNNGLPTTMTGAGPFSVTYNTNGYDTTFQKVGTGVFADSMFIIVRVFDIKPQVDYSFSPDNVCGNENIQFTNLTNNGDPFSYYWTFDDGTTSLEQDPTHQFLSAVGAAGVQTFQVKLIATNSSFCVDSVTKTVTIRSVPDAAIGNADPLVTVSTNDENMTIFKVCDGQPFYNFKFTNESSTIPINSSYAINWGDGTPDSVFASWPTGTIINHNFPTGPSTMTVSVTGSSGCVGIKKYLVYVGIFPFGRLSTGANTQICIGDSLSFNITDIENNSLGTTYYFYINDGTESQFFQHPPPGIVGHRFKKGSCSSLSSDNTDQVFNNAFGAYMLIQNPCGVASGSIVPIYVSGKPVPAINVSDPAICVNNTSRLINTSSFGNVITPTGGTNSVCEDKGKNVWFITPSTGFVLTTGSLGSLNGNPADQSTWTDAADTLDIQFTIAGIYTVKMYVANDRCGMDSTTTTICIRPIPQASFAMVQHASCGPITFDLTNTSPAVNACNPADDEYLWTIAYSDPEGCAIAGDPTYSFVNGTTETSKSPSLSFTAAGRYIIQLTAKATNAGTACADGIFSDTFYVKGPLKTAVPALPTVCVNNSIAPTVTITNCYSKGPYGYQWSFTNGIPAISTDSLPGNVSFSIPGTHPIQLIVTDSSCMQPVTINTSITVLPLPATQIANDTIICSGATVFLGGPAVAGVIYQWSPSSGLNDPGIANPEVTLNYNGTASDTTYTYYLTISQGDHCSNVDSVKITVKRKPLVIVDPASAQICLGTSTVLTADGADTYTWTPAAGLNSSTSNSVIGTPIVTTTYTVTGFLTNGCSDEKTVIVTVFDAPVANFDVTPLKICTGQPITVTNQSANATEYEWIWGDGFNSSFADGQHIYNTAGTYNISLVTRRVDVTGSVCADTMIKQVEVVNKIAAQISVSPGSNCVPYTLQANAGDVTGASLVEWVIYDSSAAPGEFQSTGPSASHVYTKAGSYSVRLVVHSAAGCTDTAFYQFKVAGTPVTTFDPRLISICGQDTTVTFIAETISDGDNAINYKWFVNDNIKGTGNTFTYHFIGTAGNTLPEEFNIKLEAQNASGCGETSVTGKVILQPIPTASIQVSPGLVLQQPNYEFTFKDIAPTNPNKIYTWSMGDRFQQTQNGQNITYKYGDTGTYTVKLLVKDFATGCTASDLVTVSILYIPGFIQVPNAICPGCSNLSVRHFLPLAKGLKKYRLTIYTTLGQKIFETTSLDAQGSPNVAWDGTLNGKPLQQDVYSWQIEGLFSNGSEWKGMLYPGKSKPVKAGFITVIK
jgi:PKD repeat protein